MKNARRCVVVAAVGIAAVAIGCGGGAPGDARPEVAAARAPAAVTSGAIPRGFRVDLRDQVHSARGLVRQPDGSYRAVCVDAPDGSLRVRGAGGQRGGRR
jgi:hypothetical protein